MAKSGLNAIYSAIVKCQLVNTVTGACKGTAYLTPKELRAQNTELNNETSGEYQYVANEPITQTQYDAELQAANEYYFENY